MSLKGNFMLLKWIRSLFFGCTLFFTVSLISACGNEVIAAPSEEAPEASIDSLFEENAPQSEDTFESKDDSKDSSESKNNSKDTSESKDNGKDKSARNNKKGKQPDIILGTTMQATFYDGNPAEGANALAIVNYIMGQEEEKDVIYLVGKEEGFKAAVFIEVNVGEQSIVYDLANLDKSFRLGLPFLEGSSTTATFYDGDPESGGTVLESLSYTAGAKTAVDTQKDYLIAFKAAAENASFVTINTESQSYTKPLNK